MKLLIKYKNRKPWNFKSKKRGLAIRTCKLINLLSKTDDFIKMINSDSKANDFIKMINSLNKINDFIKNDKFS